MLKTREIFEKIKLDNKEQYKEMLEQVNIPDFYKCIAQYTGLNINEIADEAMIELASLVHPTSIHFSFFNLYIGPSTPAIIKYVFSFISSSIVLPISFSKSYPLT